MEPRCRRPSPRPDEREPDLAIFVAIESAGILAACPRRSNLARAPTPGSAAASTSESPRCRPRAPRSRSARRGSRPRPTRRYGTSAALRSVDKALAAVAQGKTKDALLEARAWVADALNPVDAASVASGNGRVATRVDEESLLTYVRNNPGQRGEQIAAAMAADTKAIRPVISG